MELEENQRARVVVGCESFLLNNSNESRASGQLLLVAPATRHKKITKKREKQRRTTTTTNTTTKVAQETSMLLSLVLLALIVVGQTMPHAAQTLTQTDTSLEETTTTTTTSEQVYEKIEVLVAKDELELLKLELLDKSSADALTKFKANAGKNYTLTYDRNVLSARALSKKMAADNMTIIYEHEFVENAATRFVIMHNNSVIFVTRSFNKYFYWEVSSTNKERKI